MPKPVFARARPPSPLRARLTLAGAVSLIAGSLLGLSLFLPWYTATGGPYSGEALTGWFAFDRTDRVLASLGLLIVLTAAFAPSRPLTWSRLALGAAAVLAVLSELISPPGESLALLGGGFVALLASALALAGGSADFVPGAWKTRIAALARPLRQALTRTRGRPSLFPSLYRISLPAEPPRTGERADAQAPGARASTRTALAHGALIVGIAVVALVTAWPAFDRAAVDGDNLWSLSMGSRPNPVSLFVGSAFEEMPYYRPLPYLTIWAQYHAGGIAPDPYFAVNIALYLACGIALYTLVHVLTGFRLLGLASALLLLVDESVRYAILTIGSRTQSMACLFGLLALTLAFRGPLRRPRAWTAVLFLVLLSAALSKEVGLAASLAVLTLAAFRGTARRRELVLASVGAVAAYGAMRFGLAGTTLGSYCEAMGYFEETRYVCYGEPTGGGIVLTGIDQLAQYAYNVAAAFVGTFVPTMFDANGELSDPSYVEAPFRSYALSLVLLAAVCLAVIARPRKILPLLALIAGNAVLSFAVYRTRNILPGVAAHYAAAAVGFAVAGTWIAELLARRRGDGLARVLVGAGAAVLVVLALVQSAALSHAIREQNDEVGQRYPCDGPKAGEPVYTPAVLEQSKAYYGVEEGCEESESADSREPG